MGAEARARLGFATLLFMILFSLEQVFATGEYAGPAFLAATIATVLMMLLRRIGVPVIATLLTSFAAAAWYLLIVFQAHKTFYLFPTTSALGGVGKMLGRAYQHSQVDYALVPTRPGYVALIVIAFWVMATIGEIATFRWRRPLIATIGPTALFALILIVGTRAMGNLIVPFYLVALMVFLGAESSYRLRTWGQWVATWKDRRAEEPLTLTGALARRMGAACVVVALAAPIFLPSIGKGVLSWRNAVGSGMFGTGTGGGLSAGTHIDPLVSLKTEFLEQTDEELFRVRSERPLYWRMVTLTEFDGINWTADETENLFSPNGAISDPRLEAPPAQSAQHVEQRFEITGLSGLALPAAYMPAALEVHSDEAEALLEFDPLTADLQLRTPIPQGLTYTVQSLVPRASFEVMSAAQPGDLPGNYTQLPEISPAVDDLLARWTRGASTPFEELLAIQTQLRGFDYSLAVDQEASSDYLARFLLETRSGYCQQFATAFALLARRRGYEARVSVGFLPGQTSPEAPDEYLVRGTDAHAWPEVFFEGIGWIAFEPTPREEAVPPGYTNPEIAGTTTVAGLRGPENLAPTPTPGVGDGNLQEFRDPAGRPGRGGNVPGQNPGPSRWERAFERLAVTLIVGVALFLLAVPLLKELKTKRRYRQAETRRGRATAAFLDFQDAAAELASPRRTTESAVAYATRLSRSHEVTPAKALRLARIFEAAQYAPRDIADKEVTEARRLAHDLRRTLWSEATWWERAARLFAPRGLTS